MTDDDEQRTLAARVRAAGIVDEELRKRKRLAAELVEELRRPLIPGSQPHDLEAIAALATDKPARQRGRPRG